MVTKHNIALYPSSYLRQIKENVWIWQLVAKFIYLVTDIISKVKCLIRASPAIRGILPIQKVQLFILAIQFLMSTSTDPLFY